MLTFMKHWELGSYCHPRFRSMDMDEQNIESKFYLIYDIRVTVSYAFWQRMGKYEEKTYFSTLLTFI